MAICRDDVAPFTADVGGPVSAGEIASLAADPRLIIVHVRSDEPRETWAALNDHLFSARGDVILSVDSFFPGGADLAVLRHAPNVRRLCVTSSGTEAITSVESVAALPDLEALQIGWPTLKSSRPSMGAGRETKRCGS
jgi:hypothetical protein